MHIRARRSFSAEPLNIKFARFFECIMDIQGMFQLTFVTLLGNISDQIHYNETTHPGLDIDLSLPTITCSPTSLFYYIITLIGEVFHCQMSNDGWFTPLATCLDALSQKKMSTDEPPILLYHILVLELLCHHALLLHHIFLWEKMGTVKSSSLVSSLEFKWMLSFLNSTYLLKLPPAATEPPTISLKAVGILKTAHLVFPSASIPGSILLLPG